MILWDGAIYEDQVNVANELGGSYDIWHSSTNKLTTNGLEFAAIEIRSRQAGVTGGLISEQFGVEFGYEKCDFRAGLFADGVYRNHLAPGLATTREGFEGGFFADKMFTASTAAGIFVSFQTGQKYPIFGVNFHATFGNGAGFLGLF